MRKLEAVRSYLSVVDVDQTCSGFHLTVLAFKKRCQNREITSGCFRGLENNLTLFVYIRAPQARDSRQPICCAVAYKL